MWWQRYKALPTRAFGESSPVTSVARRSPTKACLIPWALLQHIRERSWITLPRTWEKRVVDLFSWHMTSIFVYLWDLRKFLNLKNFVNDYCSEKTSHSRSCFTLIFFIGSLTFMRHQPLHCSPCPQDQTLGPETSLDLRRWWRCSKVELPAETLLS